MSDFIINSFEKIMNLPWKEIFSGIGSTFIGACFAFSWNVRQERKKLFEIQKTNVIEYFCYLNTLLKNICSFGSDLQVSINASKDPNVQFLPCPSSRIRNGFNGQKLSFILEKHKTFYGKILQFEIELKNYAEQLELYKETHNAVYLNNLNDSFVIVCAALTSMIENTNAFLENSYKITLIDQQIINNINIVNNGSQKWLEENKNTTDVNILKIAFQKEQEYNTTKRAWRIDFSKN